MKWDVHFLHLIDHDSAHCLLWKVCMGHKSLNFFATADSYGCVLPCMIPQESAWISCGCGVPCLRSMLWIEVLKDLLLHLIAHSSAFFAGYLIKVDNLTKHFKVEKEKKYMSGSSASKYWLFFETMEELIQIHTQGSCDPRWSIKQRRFNSIGVREWWWAAPGNLIFCGRMY